MIVYCVHYFQRFDYVTGPNYGRSFIVCHNCDTRIELPDWNKVTT